MIRSRYAAVLVTAAGLIAVTSACGKAPASSSQAPTSSVVTMQLDSATALFATEGYRLAERYRGGSLGHGEDEELFVNLSGGTSYLIAGVCDFGCEDLDLELSSPSGREVDSDNASDDFPIVRADGVSAGRYSLVVSMAACGNSDHCSYGVAVYRK